MKRFFTLVLPMILVAVLTGCATGNTAISTESAPTLEKKIVNGKTTKAEISSMFGEPSEKSTKEGKETWGYVMEKLSGRALIPFVGLFTGDYGASRKHLRVEFNKKGVVTEHEFSESKI